MPKALSCGFIVFARETGMVLACHPFGHPGGPDMAYDIPKGHLEDGETPIETAKRELKEETGIVLPDDAPIHEIGHVPYQTKKALHLFSTSLPSSMLQPDRLRCESTFSDESGHERIEIDSYILAGAPDVFFKNLQPYVKQEMARVSMPEPMCFIRGTDSETGEPVTMTIRKDGIMTRTYRDTIVRILDDNLYPHGYSADVELADGTIVSVDMDDLQRGLVDGGAKVDVDGSYRMLPEFPADQWFDQALNVDNDRY